MTLYHYCVHDKLHVRWCGVLWAESAEAAERAVKKMHPVGQHESITVTTIMKKGGK